MKITKKLLERHGMGLCSEEEKQAIEKWFETLDDPSQSLTVEDDYDDDSIWSKMSQALPELENRMSTSKVNKIMLFQRSIKYAAAACFALVMFFGGRLSVGTANANPTPKDLTADHLFIYGGNETKGNLSGSAFEIEFEGLVKLYNNSMIYKTVHVGDTSFNLKPHKYYYLSGNPENPRLIHGINERNKGNGQIDSLEGDFSILKIDK